MRASISTFVVHRERSDTDAIGGSGHRDSQPGPSYVQSVLFGKRRTRGTRPLAAPLAGGTMTHNAPAQERN